ncbi:glycosyl transferase family 2 [Parabacteroides sp. PF5-6]|uniref:cytidylyltransferase domain-containing protein n=1 Tax=Parabacteroides sp. PF5-6 TaxID=1742403 RepID=UPI002406FB78|nr:glycosyl transferase family 2 [Parabacteroides sp. PF5-6]MDF9830648.1 spore coat polysaccharide biosynthesis protein SpsF (cytidylyltransferase family) [Parabacteroides sp. PF5-6]
MKTSEQIYFLVQARIGSTRLPGKILLPFFDEKSILELLIDKLVKIGGKDAVILTTSVSPANDVIESLALQKGVHCFRGAENDVLDRFIKAAEAYHVKRMIRVCSDNPFLECESIIRLLDDVADAPCDYIAFDIFGTPSIQTHYGFWTEYVTLEALKKVASLTEEPLYHEHVTNYIYTHPESFSIRWLAGPEELKEHTDIRLTIDTEEDFRSAQKIYKELSEEKECPTIKDIIAYLDRYPDFYLSMKNQIIKNSKK